MTYISSYKSDGKIILNNFAMKGRGELRSMYFHISLNNFRSLFVITRFQNFECGGYLLMLILLTPKMLIFHASQSVMRGNTC